MLKTQLRCASVLMAVSLLILEFAPLPAATAGVEGDAELLTLVAEAIRQNREMVGTWKGSARILNSNTAMNGDNRAIRSTAEFACDAERDAKRWNFTLGDTVETVDGVGKMVHEGFPKNTMLRDGAYFRLHYSPSGERPYILGIHDPSSRSAELHLSSDDFDPFFFFCGSEQEFSGLLDRYYSRRDSDRTNVTVAREGERIIVTRQMDNSSFRYEFDPEMGYNLVRSHTESWGGAWGSHSTWDKTIEYENIDGVFVPKKFILDTQERYKDKPEKDCDRTWEVVFKNDLVNEPLSADEFSLAALGLLPGDFIQDARTGTHWIHDGKDFGPDSPSALNMPPDRLADLVDESVPEDVDKPEPAPLVETPVEEPVPEPAAPRWPLYAAAAIALLAIVLAVIGMKLLRRRP